MRILQIHNHYKFFGGEDKVALNERELLRSRGEDVIVFEKHNKSIDEFGFLDKAAFFPNSLYHRRHLRELEELVTRTRPDVVHLHNIYPLISPAVYPLLKRLGVPSVQSFHDHRLAMLCPQANAWRKDTWCELCHKGNYLHAVRHRCVRGSLPISMVFAFGTAWTKYAGVLEKCLTLGIVFNGYMRDKLAGIGFPQDRLVEKPHFVQEDPGQPSYSQGAYAVYMGAVAAHKGIFTLLKACRDLPPGFKIRILGDGEAMAEVRERAAREFPGSVEVLGFVGGLERLDILRGALFSVVPSECFETFGMSVLESFACGVPVVGSTIGSIPFLVKDGETGLLFPPRDDAALGERMRRLIADPEACRAMGRKGRQVFQESYGPDRNYGLLMGIYREAVARGAR